MRHMYTVMKQDNERETYNECVAYLQEQYSLVERKLRNKEFTGGFYEYDMEMKNFQAFVLENGPCGPNKRVIMLEFVQKVQADAAEYIGKTISNELELQKTISGDQITKLSRELKEVKGEHSREKEDFEMKLRSIEVQKAELSAVEQNLRENVLHLQSEKLSIEREMSERIEQERRSGQTEVEEALTKL